MKKLNLLSVLLLMMVGCTTSATKSVIQNYRKSSQYEELAFNNSLRIAHEQMLLNLIQYVTSHPTNLTGITDAIRVTWSARTQLEKCHEQYMLAHALNEMTVGQYLYDQQGWFNTILAAETESLQTTAAAGKSADDATGISPIKDILTTTDSSTTKPAGTLQDFNNLLNILSGH